MKNKVLIVCAGLLLLIFLVFGTYCWYLYFLRISGGLSSSNNSKNLQLGSIVFKDYGNSVYDSDAEIIEDNNIEKVPSYKFDVINEGDKSIYKLYIEDLPANMIDDGCTEDTILKRDQLKYQLKFNNEIIKEDYLANIKDNILDEREIEKNITNSYELKIYIHDEATNWTAKHYHYKVVLGK